MVLASRAGQRSRLGRGFADHVGSHIAQVAAVAISVAIAASVAVAASLVAPAPGRGLECDRGRELRAPDHAICSFVGGRVMFLCFGVRFLYLAQMLISGCCFE